MKFPYIYTTIITLPLGYHTRVMVPVSKIKERVSKNVSDYNIEVKFSAFRKGANFFEESKIINKLSMGILEFEISDQDGLCSDSGYAELTFVEKNHQPIFVMKKNHNIINKQRNMRVLIQLKIVLILVEDYLDNN